MKNKAKLGLFAVILATVSFSACSDDYEDLFPEGKWEYKMIDGNDSIIVTIDNYPNKKKFFSTVIKFNPRVIFVDGIWNYCDIKDDAIAIRFEGSPNSDNWIIEHVSYGIINLKYNDSQTTDNYNVYNYTFKLKK